MYNISDNDLLHQQTIISDRYEIKKKKKCISSLAKTGTKY